MVTAYAFSDKQHCCLVVVSARGCKRDALAVCWAVHVGAVRWFVSGCQAALPCNGGFCCVAAATDHVDEMRRMR
jgi:hypothetical protein